MRLLLTVCWLLSQTVSIAAQSPAPYPNQTSGTAAHTSTANDPQRMVSWKLLPSNVLHDQKQVWLFPASLARGRHWAPTAGLVSVTAALVALDPHTAPYFRQTQTFNQFNRVFSFNNTVAIMAVVPTTTYAVGWVRHDSYSQQTAQLAAEAVLAAEIPALVTRDVTRRLSPGDIPPYGDFSNTWFRGAFLPGPRRFPVRSYRRSLLHRYCLCRALSPASLGPLDRLRVGGLGRVFAGHPPGAFPLRCVCGCGSRIHDKPLRCFAATVAHHSQRHCLYQPSKTDRMSLFQRPIPAMAHFSTSLTQRRRRIVSFPRKPRS